jgi:hypothetical protein
MLAVLLGHDSGFSWDEALLVMTPIAIVAGALFLANQRAKRFDDDERVDPGDGTAPDAGPGPGERPEGRSGEPPATRR